MRPAKRTGATKTVPLVLGGGGTLLDPVRALKHLLDVDPVPEAQHATTPLLPVRRESRGGEAPGGFGGERRVRWTRVALPASDSGNREAGFVASANSLARRRGNRTRSVARGGGRPKGRR